MLKKICTVQSQTNLETVDAIRKDENFLCCSINLQRRGWFLPWVQEETIILINKIQRTIFTMVAHLDIR